MQAVIPSLSGIGWIKDPNTMLTTMFTNMLVSEVSQSTVYHGTITSLPSIIALYQDDINEMTSVLQSALTKYFQSVFNIVDITVNTYDVLDRTYKLEIVINVTHNSQVYNLATAFVIDGGILTGVLKELNK